MAAQVADSNARATAVERQNDELIREMNGLRQESHRQQQIVNDQQRQLEQYHSMLSNAKQLMKTPDGSRKRDLDSGLDFSMSHEVRVHGVHG